LDGIKILVLFNYLGLTFLLA